MRTPRAAAARHVRASVAASPAWKPHATLALVTTSSIASSSPSRHTPKLSPRSALRSISLGEASVTTASLSRCRRGPAVLRHEVAKRAAECPAVDLELRSLREVRNGAKAKDRHGFRAVRHGQQCTESNGIEDRHPTHPEAFGARGQPQVL